MYILRKIFLIIRLFLCYNESVRLRNKFAHGGSIGKKNSIFMSLPIFGFPHKKMRKYKKTILGRNPKNNRSKKRMLECQIKVKIGLGGSKMQKVKI